MQQYSSFILPVVIIVAFYFLLIRPQQQQAKKQHEMVEALVPGAQIMTIGGIYATVVSVEDDRIRVAVADGSELEIAARAVSAVLEVPSDDVADEADEPPMEDSADSEAAEKDAEQ